MNAKFAFILLVCLAILANCADSNDPTINVREKSNNRKTVDESYPVYSAFLKTIRTGYSTGGQVDLFVIIENTEHFPSTIDITSLDLGEELAEEFGLAIADFNSKINTSQRLTESLDIEKSYILLSDEDLNFEREKDDSFDFWKEFNKKFPHSAGILRFSQVGFDARKQHAFLYLDLICGGTCAEQDFVLLTKVNGEWKLTKTILSGVS